MQNSLNKDLKGKANWVRQEILKMAISSNRGHLGGSLSCVEILIALHYKIMSVLPNMEILTVNDTETAKKAPSLAYESKKPLYIRLGAKDVMG